jgi:hypothetical protein
MTPGRLFAALAGVAVLGVVVASSDFGQTLMMGRWSYTKSVTNDRSRFFRLVVNLAYKGEPVIFDIVVGCNVRVTTYKDNDRTVEVGVAPTAYGLKMKDGRGIVVRPPEACRDETTENGQVPPTLLPLIVTYEKADEPWFGLAYVTDDAFDSPRSDLKYFNATISKATKEEWEAWRRTEAPKNFVTYELLGINPNNRFDNVRWEPSKRFMGSVCQSFYRLKLPEAARELVRPSWPASRPTYWYPNDAARLALYTTDDEEAERKGLLTEGYRLERYLGSGANFFPGMRRRQPGAQILFRTTLAGEVYPAWSDRTLSRLDQAGQYPADILGKPHLIWAEADVRPEMRGFAYCDGVNNIDDLPYSGLARFKFESRVNGQAINDELTRPPTNPSSFYERDEYLFVHLNAAIVNIWGGL